MNNDLEQIEAYLSYGYTPFRKVQCVERIIGAWVASAVLLVIGERSVAWGLLVRKNIKSNKYSEAAKPQKIGAWAYIGGAVGVLAAPVLLAGWDGLTVSSVGLISLSLLLSVGSLNLQRALLDIKTQRGELG